MLRYQQNGGRKGAHKDNGDRFRGGVHRQFLGPEFGRVVACSGRETGNQSVKGEQIRGAISEG